MYIGGRILVPVLAAVLFASSCRSAAAQTILPPPADPDSSQTRVSPRGAFFRSLVLPGWGQSYVGAPGRGAVYFTLAGASGWMALSAHNQRADALEQQAWLRETSVIAPGDRTGLVEARSQQFEDWIALTIFFFFAAGADAYVAAYLSDFDERMGVTPGADGSLQIRASFPVEWPR